MSTEVVVVKEPATVVRVSAQEDQNKLTVAAEGMQGAPGATGATGPAGPTGPTGPTGPAVDTSNLVTTNTIQTVSGTKTFSNPPFVPAPNSTTLGDNHAVGRSYVTSRGDNLFTNGSGGMGNSYNMSTLTYDPADKHGGQGSFKVNVSQQSRTNDELIPVDPTKSYTISMWAKSGEPNGTLYNPANVQYLGIACYDAQGNSMSFIHRNKQAGVDTTLAVALNPGDTTVTLNSAASWYNGASPNARQFAWWPYVDGAGYSWPNYSYTRNVTLGLAGSSYSTNGAYTNGGVVGNVLTLTQPWPGPALPINTPIQNVGDGATYIYALLGGGAVPNTWTKYSATFMGLNANKLIGQDGMMLPPGCAAIKLLMLINYHVAADNMVKYSDIHVTEHGALANDVHDAPFTFNGPINTAVNSALLFSKGTFYVNAAGGAVSITLPSLGSTAMPPYRQTFIRTDASANVVTFLSASNINGVASIATLLPSQWSAVTLVNNGTSWFVASKG